MLSSTTATKVANDALLNSGSNTSGRSHAAHTAFWVISLGLACAGFFTPNGLLTAAAFAVLPVLGLLLWREGEPPVLLFGCAFQWLQATAAIFYTNHFGVTLDEAFGSNELSIATWLSIIAVVVLAAGIRIGFMGTGASRQAELERDAANMDVTKIAILYVVSLIVSGVTEYFAWRLTSITQLLLAVGALKWAVVFLLCYTVFQQRRGYVILLGCIGLEFAMGLFGIFANFKSVFFVLVVAAMSSPLALQGRRLFSTVVCFMLLFVMGVVWTAVKMDYRTFLANEETANEEAIPVERKFEKLTDLVAGITWENLTDGVDALVMRISYVNFFALTLENVPAHIPFENGALWQGAVMHVLMPRLLFPDKPALDDSERTNKYTGMQVSGMESGTSIGIGYVGESYVDYGPIRMFVPIFLLGLLYGVINRLFISRTRYKLIGAAFAVSVLIFIAYEIETSNVKLVGGVVAAALVSAVIYKALGATIANYLRQSPAAAVKWQSPAVATPLH